MKENMTPKEIVSYLDGYIIGQYEAKKAVAMLYEIVIEE